MFYSQSSTTVFITADKSPCVGSAAQFSPWKLQMVGITMTMADIIIQTVLVAEDSFKMMLSFLLWNSNVPLDLVC